MKNWLLIAAAGASFGLTSACHGDTLWLKNGDRISAKIQSLDAGKLLLIMPNGRQLQLEWGDVQTLQSDAAFDIVQDSFAPAISSHLRPAEPGMIQLDDNAKIAIESIKSLTLPTPLLRDFVWEGRWDFDLNSKREEKENSDKLNSNLDLQFRQANWRHHLNGESEFEIKNEEKSSDHWFVNYALDRLITDHWFWRVNEHFERDQISEYALKQELGTGPGYRFWDNSRGHFELASLLERDFYHLETSLSGFKISEDVYFNTATLSWDWLKKFNAADLELYANGKLQRPLQLKINLTFETETAKYSTPLNYLDIAYIATSECGLRYNLNQYVHASLHFNYDYTKAEADFHSLERHYGIGLGVRW